MILDAQDASVAEIAQAARALAEGKLIGLPTETVYGLAANADDEQAVAQIFTAKGRPSNHPLIVHIAHRDVERAVAHYAQSVPLFAQKLMDAFWPGALTLILPRRPNTAVASTGGQDSVGLRCPSHPVAQALLEACQQLEPSIFGLSAPSANKFGRISPTTAAHVEQEFGDDLLVLDGGACQVGIESTIIDCTRNVPVLLRPGGISRSAIEQACGLAPLDKEEAEALSTPAPRASGTLLAHYAPNAKVRLMSAAQLEDAVEILGAEAKNIAIYHRSPLRNTAKAKGLIMRSMPEDASRAARHLFSDLRELDSQGVSVIWVETPPSASDWEGVGDRLRRAAAAGEGVVPQS